MPEQSEHTAQGLIMMLRDTGMSDAQIARAIGCAEATISRVRTGKAVGVIVRPWLQEYVNAHRDEMIADLKRKIAQLESTNTPSDQN